MYLYFIQNHLIESINYTFYVVRSKGELQINYYVLTISPQICAMEQ